MLVDPAAFWGPISSSVDWCEINYEHSRYVCEFFNTFSSTALIAVGATGFWLHRGTLDARFQVAFLCWASGTTE